MSEDGSRQSVVGSRTVTSQSPTADCQLPTAALWIFGYGSLMWRPDFEYEEAVHARVDGWRRGFFIYSTHHRGSHARPGLVLALDRGGACEGIAYRVAPEKAAHTLAYLRAREQVNGVYREAHVVARLLVGNQSARQDARLEDGSGRRVAAVAFVVERRHPSYVGPLPLARQAQLIRGARGVSGCNLTYLVSTVRHLQRLGVRERALERLLAVAGPHFAAKAHARELDRAAASLRAVCLRFPPSAPLMSPCERRRFTHRKQIAEWALQ